VYILVHDAAVGENLKLATKAIHVLLLYAQHFGYQQIIEVAQFEHEFRVYFLSADSESDLIVEPTYVMDNKQELNYERIWEIVGKVVGSPEEE